MARMPHKARECIWLPKVMILVTLQDLCESTCMYQQCDVF